MEKRVSRRKAMSEFYNEPTHINKSFNETYPKGKYQFIIKPGMGLMARRK